MNTSLEGKTNFSLQIESILPFCPPPSDSEESKYVKIADRKEALIYAVEASRPGDVVLLCGKGHEDYQIIGKEKVHFSEKEILAEIKAGL